MRDHDNDDHVALRRKILGGSVGNQCFPVAEVAILGGGGRLFPFGKNNLVVVDGHCVVDWCRRSGARKLVKEELSFCQSEGSGQRASTLEPRVTNWGIAGHTKPLFDGFQCTRLGKLESKALGDTKLAISQ